MIKMNKKLYKVFFLLFAFVFLCNSVLFAKTKGKSIEAPEEEILQAPQGRIIVLVVDISQSIKNQLDDIIDGLCEEIVEKRLKSGDYCVVVPLGDAANSDKADSFGVQFSSDKEKIKAYLNQIKTWMPKNLNTDIGAAMKKSFEYIKMINAENNGNMYEPLVLFITDGEIFGSVNSISPLRYETTEDIFNDYDMNPDLNSYDNWWFLGIENEGVPLEHIKSIAQKVGAYPDRYETLNDMDQFGILFDSWLASIPDPEPKDIGKITFTDVKLDGKKLSTKDSSYTVVPNNAEKFLWTIKSSYSNKNVVINFNSVEAIFQEDKTGNITSFNLIPEAGNIEMSPKSSRNSMLNVNLPPILGKGKLKLRVSMVVNAANLSSSEEIPEYLFFVEFKTPQQILFSKLLPLAIALLAIIIIVVIIIIVKATAAVKIRMDVVGKSTGKKAKSVSIKINKKKEFGSKPSAPFKLEGPNYAYVIGSIERTGKNTWKINKSNSEAFINETDSLSPYKLGKSINITLKDGSSVNIKFRKVRH